MEKEHLKIWQRTTPSQRLQWLEEMLKFFLASQKRKNKKSKLKRKPIKI